MSLCLSTCETDYEDDLNKYDFTQGWRILGRRKVRDYHVYISSLVCIEPTLCVVTSQERKCLKTRPAPDDLTLNYMSLYDFYVVT